MEQWQLLYASLAVAILVVAGWFALTSPVSPLLVGLSGVIGVGLLVVVRRPSAYANFVFVVGALAVPIGGYLALGDDRLVGFLLGGVGIAAIARGVSYRRTRRSQKR